MEEGGGWNMTRVWSFIDGYYARVCSTKKKKMVRHGPVGKTLEMFPYFFIDGEFIEIFSLSPLCAGDLFFLL